MAFIATSKKFRLPSRVAKIIQLRNYNSTFSESEKGVWLLEASSLFVYKTWFQQNNFPPPWNQALYQLLKHLSWAPHIEEATSVFCLSDQKIDIQSVPLTSDLQLFISELSTKFSLDSREVILGILHQAYDQLTR